MHKILIAALLVLACGAASARSLLIDVRTPEEFASGHIDGALNIDHQVIAQRIGMAGASKEDEIILYCRSGRRSAAARASLEAQGYKRVLDYGSQEQAQQRLKAKQK